jgi:hypothetical protein
MEMLGRVPARRLIAAADMAADKAEAEMNPSPVRFEAFLAVLGRARRDVLDLVEMRAACRHAGLQPLQRAPKRRRDPYGETHLGRRALASQPPDRPGGRAGAPC